jgi:hypothetical protein
MCCYVDRQIFRSRKSHPMTLVLQVFMIFLFIFEFHAFFEIDVSFLCNFGFLFLFPK